jgi:REP element-mobilizing transposase RayT
MSRLPRIIVPGIPHHVTQRGNRRQQVFMKEDDYALYRDWLANECRSNGVEVWSYCLMPNHVHLILAPSNETGLSRAVGETHRRYSGYINARFEDDGLVTIRPLLDRVDNLAEFLEMPEDPEHLAALTKGQTIGRPLMDDQKLGELEKQLGRALRQGKRGRPASQKNDPKQRKLV